jgi:hypothetical protein
MPKKTTATLCFGAQNQAVLATRPETRASIMDVAFGRDRARGVVEKVPMFDGCDETFISRLVQALRPEPYALGDTVRGCISSADVAVAGGRGWGVWERVRLASAVILMGDFAVFGRKKKKKIHDDT